MTSPASSVVLPSFCGKIIKKLLYFLLILSMIPIGSMEQINQYPADCFYDYEVAECIKLCREPAELTKCYDEVNPTLSFEEKKALWVRCTFRIQAIRCFDYCQTNPDYVICKYGKAPIGKCSSIQVPNLDVMDKCGSTNDACIKSNIKDGCVAILEYWQKRNTGNRNSNKPGTDVVAIQEYWEKHDEDVENCVTNSFIKYKDCLSLPVGQRKCFYEHLVQKLQDFCLKFQPKKFSKEDWEDRCIELSSKSICQEFCHHKPALQLCIDQCANTNNAQEICATLKTDYDNCLRNNNCSYTGSNISKSDCASICYYGVKLKDCQTRYCDSVVNPHLQSKCLAECQDTYSYDAEVEKCQKDRKHRFSNVATPKECLDKICSSFRNDSKVLSDCILSNCKKILPQADVDEYCKNPRRVQIFQRCFEKDIPSYLQDIFNPDIVAEAFSKINDCENFNYKIAEESDCLKYDFIAIKCKVHCLTIHSNPDPSMPNEFRRELSCPVVAKPKVFQLTNFANCRWKIDFSTSRTPYKLWSHYFNEKEAMNVQEKLEKPDTTHYLDKTALAQDGGQGYFVFPYFITIRDDCEVGYEESFYRMIINGGYPHLTLQYAAVSNRAKVGTAMKIKFRTSLVDLDPVDNSEEILHKRTQEELSKCHKGLCYPAFSAPMVLLHIPIFGVTVSADDVFEELSTSVYVSTFHSRTVPGLGSIHFASKDVVLNPYQFFPLRRLMGNEDRAIDEYQTCVRQAETSCPPLYNPEHSPLNIDDLLSPSYTAGSAPVVVFAGFFTPTLLILGDPDMELFTYFEWIKGTTESKGTIFEEKTKCTYDSGRPMYSYLDLSDNDFPIKHYRIGYDKLNYNNGTEARAIFDVIAMEDRLLLVTLHGLVALYGNSYETQESNKLWTAEEEDKLRECFKFVRSARTSMMTSDVIVGVTYGQETGNGKEKVFMGKLVHSGNPLIWKEIVSATTEEYENDDTTEIEKICYKAKHQKMANVDGIVVGFPSWCVALDATPVPAKENTIQVLIRMTIRINDLHLKVRGSLFPKNDTDIYYYIIASFTSYEGNSVTNLHKWTIDSMLPRIPCVVDHNEAVQTIMAHGLQTSFFSDSNSETNPDPGCTIHNSGADEFENYLFLSHITYTRMLSSHMFLYGSSLIHSTDGGRSFSYLHVFPKVENPKESQRPQNIVVMAFDDSGHFAFLTNLRELWYGSTGELKPIQLRPSEGYSMTQTVVSNIPGLKDAIPFSVMFDSKNNLFEMVAVTRDHETTHILKRPVLVSQIFQNNYFVKKMMEASAEKEEDVKNNPPKPLILKNDEDRGSWELFCPFSSPQVSENYSESYSRSQVFFLRPPHQHPSMGEFFLLSSLTTYQAAAFRIIYGSLFNPKIEAYSRVAADPILAWQSSKQIATKIGYLNWILGNASDHGILIDPDDNKRELKETSNEIISFLSLDYGMIVTYELEFSIKDESSFALTSFATQNIELIQLNVDNANGSLLRINTERIRKEQSASVQFKVIMELNPASGLPQSLPGKNLFHIPVVFHFIGGFGKCFKTQEKSVDNAVSMLVLAGCLDSTAIMFDWNSTLRSIKFRDKNFNYGNLDQCYNGEFACVFARQTVKLHFEIFDLARQVYKPFRGAYTMRVVAGGYSRNDMIRYSEEEQDAYNVPGVSDVSLIWAEWDEESNSKVKRKSGDSKKGAEANGVPLQQVVLQSGKSTIKWACHTLSPCARISPTIFGETVYWFRISMSNKGVDNNTLCLYEREFDLLLYGLPPSPEFQLLVTVVFCLIILGILYTLYYCCKSHKNVWRSNKVKLAGWFQIASDTCPKCLKGLTTASRAEDEALRKAQLLGSIQGHLQVPDLSEKALQDLEKGEQVLIAKDKLEKELEMDAASIRSNTSSTILPAVNPHTGAGTWTDLVYEQIITKRLQAMVMKNKQMREGILKKVDLSRMKENLELEDRFLSTHGSKASSESAYQPPMFGRRVTKKKHSKK